MEDETFFEILAVEQLWNELPNILNEADYKCFKASYLKTIQDLEQTENESRQAELLLPLMNAIWKLPLVNNRLQEIRNEKSLLKPIILGLGAILSSLGLGNRENIDAYIYNNRVRTILIKPGGIGETKTIKFQNLEFDFGDFGGLAVGIVLAAQEAVEKKHPIILAASIIMIASSIYKASTKVISEQEATVFWGLINIVGSSKQATFQSIFRCTNSERTKLGLDLLTKEQAKASLLKLQEIKAIEMVDEKHHVWKIIEKYKIKANSI